MTFAAETPILHAMIPVTWLAFSVRAIPEEARRFSFYACVGVGRGLTVACWRIVR